MSEWIIYASITYFIWAMSVLVDKYFIDRKLKSYLIYAVYGGFFNVFVLFLIPIFGFSVPSAGLLFLSLFAGLLFFISLMFFFKALSYDDASIVVPLSPTSIIVLLLSFIFLGDSLVNNEIIAFILFIFGGFLLSVKDFNLKKLKFSPALKYVLASSVIFAIMLIMMKYILTKVAVFEVFILLRIGTLIGALLLLFNKNVRTEAKEKIKSLSPSLWTIFSANQLICIGAQFLYDLAISLGTVAIVNASQGLQYVFVFILAMLATKLFPKIVQEDFTTKTIIKKIIGLILVVLALFFLNISF